MLTKEFIDEQNKKINPFIYTYIDKENPIVFLDFEVFKYDWMLCYSEDGIHIKHIVNDINLLKDLFLYKYQHKILMAYNGLNYDKLIMLGALNDINLKEINDNIIYNPTFRFYQVYGDRATLGKDASYYDPSPSTGSLKSYEANEGENIYESSVDFNLDRQLTQAEIDETIKYCSFDVEQLIKYFYMENFDTFLGHIDLLETTMKIRDLSFSFGLAKTDTYLVGTYLCSNSAPVVINEDDVITLPDNIDLGKYTNQINKMLKIPIKYLKNGKYNDLNAWSLKLIQKSMDEALNSSKYEKLKNKEEKLLKSINTKKHQFLDLENKLMTSSLTSKQEEKRQTLDIKIKEQVEQLINLKQELNEIRQKLEITVNLVNQYKLLSEEDRDKMTGRKLLKQIIEIMKVSDNNRFDMLCQWLSLSDEEIFRYKYTIDKRETIFNNILVTVPFEVVLDIKGIHHAFKTGGIHSITNKSMSFDCDSEKDKNRKLLIADVGSLYPNLMRVFNLCSKSMDNPSEYAQMIFDRIELKKKKDPFAATLKLILNRTYGAMGDKFNLLYDPVNRLKVCIFGEAAIIDLLDKLENQILSLEIFQSNTDGIIVSCDKNEYDRCVNIIHDWENRTGLEMEIEECIKLYQSDVSNYILVS